MENSSTSVTKNPPSTFYRWMVLLFVSLAMFGNYYIYDSIAPVADLLKSQLNFTDEQIGSLYSVYSVAAIIILLLGGYIIDKFGTKISTLIFGIICFIAAILTAVSPEFEVMIAGRFLLGIGAEPLIVAVTTALAKWFKGKELSFAFGINLTIARLGQVAIDNSPTWAGSYYSNWQDPLFLAVVIGSTCVAGSVVYYFLESRAEKKYDLGEAEETEKLVFKDLFKFNWSFWLIVGLCITFYSAIFPFRTFAIKYYMEAHNVTRETAGFLNSILPIAGMIATPIFGFIVDKTGKRALYMMFGSILLIPVYLMMAYTDITLYIPIAMMGIAFSLIPAVMWPAVAYIIHEKRLGTAYSVMTIIQQFGVMLMNWLIGKTNDMSGASAENPDGYIPGLWIFSILGFLGLLFSYLLRKRETGPNGHGLEKSMKEMQAETAN